MNLLVASGHRAEEVWHWPLATVMDETLLAVERENRRIASEAIALRSAAAAVMTKEGGRHFDELIGRLMGDD